MGTGRVWVRGGHAELRARASRRHGVHARRRDAHARSRVRVMRPNARVPTRRERQKKPQVFGGSVVGQMRTFQPWTVTPWPIMEDALADCELESGRRGQ